MTIFFGIVTVAYAIVYLIWCQVKQAIHEVNYTKNFIPDGWAIEYKTAFIVFDELVRKWGAIKARIEDEYKTDYIKKNNELETQFAMFMKTECDGYAPGEYAARKGVIAALDIRRKPYGYGSTGIPEDKESLDTRINFATWNSPFIRADCLKCNEYIYMIRKRWDQRLFKSNLEWDLCTKRHPYPFPVEPPPLDDDGYLLVEE